MSEISSYVDNGGFLRVDVVPTDSTVEAVIIDQVPNNDGSLGINENNTNQDVL